ncbi:META domain-containing protein [Fibrisoma montanum]|uniref:META domain-containing protein n=1 Tax=Fibrisoma montanum TaxID=2305895 RepID=A0A418MEJ8_9BACT|nr:META domain-containing protein [Fibrisoma montanum]RIV25239.1 META domain-containing protein [Fibrisoma montanum]
MRILLLSVLLSTAACQRTTNPTMSSTKPATQARQSSGQAERQFPDWSRYLRAGDELIAMGNEPFWSLAVNAGKGTLRFKSMDGDSINAPLPQRNVDSDGVITFDAEVASGRLKVLFAPDSCVDTMSGQRMDYRVQVNVKGKTYTGCGVSLRQMALLNDIWVLTTLQGRSVKPSGPRNELPRLEISLTEGRVSGTTGCNRLNGRVQADSRQVQFGPLATTRMACMGEAGQLEGDFLNALNQPLTYRVAEGKLTLLHNNLPVLVLKKVD